MNTSINLLGTTSRVETPIIGVKIGDAVLGIYSEIVDSENSTYKYIINPKYLKSLDVKKVNGTVNQYTLRLDYPITARDDPNYIDKIIARVADTRTITFGYGDASVPTFLYREEKAIITRVKKRPNVSSSVKSYTIYAVSTGALSTAGTFNFRKRVAKPSDVIKEILYEPKYGLTQVFYGMKNREMVEMKQLIRSDDEVVTIEAKQNISILDYLAYLVDCMNSVERVSQATSYANSIVKNAIANPLSSKKFLSKSVSDTLKLIKKSIYVLLFEDGITEDLKGPYFKIERSDKLKEKASAYEIDIGYPSQNVVTNFEIDDDETYALYYKFTSQVQPNSYSETITDNGEIEPIYYPSLGSNSPLFKVTEQEKTWWTKVTQYPIKATITFKGLLRPAILMSYVRVNILYYGNKDIDSGLYIVLSQQDTIDTNGYRTTLKLLRVGGDDTYAD